jgi:hypothetical protein
LLLAAETASGYIALLWVSRGCVAARLSASDIKRKHAMTQIRFVVPTLALCAFAGFAYAQPDVTLADPNDWTNYGLVNGVRGYAMGSYTCNRGTSELAWNFNGTPGLAMNMYRLHNGRFQQVGWSFVKLACCAAQSSDTRCGNQCSPTGNGLGPGCLDVYSAGWNGGQGALGPRSQQNAFTGQFQAHNPPPGALNAVFRRIQARDTDLNTTLSGQFQGARFFAEGVYVASDESAAGRLNNATYRPLTMQDATNRTFTFGNGIARVGEPAIFAWRDHGLGLNQPDNSVRIVNVDVPNEGRFWYGMKVRDLGNGRWLYDYVVFNLNSDRSGGSFEIPLPCGVTATNAGFSSPWYHSGELYNSNPWSISISNGSIRWQTDQTFAQNANANAIRWGSTFNFWFEANTPPALNQQAFLGLFKPVAGQQDSVALSLSAPSAPAASCDGIDFNRNGVFPEDQDVADYLSVLAGGPCPYAGTCDLDFNNNCVFPEDADVIAFFDVLAGASCP